MSDFLLSAASEVIGRCETLAAFTEEPGFLTRTFLSAEMKRAYSTVRRWMEEAGMSVRVDSAGNLRGLYGNSPDSPRLIIGSHLDTVPRAGKFDGILGVILGIHLVARLAGRKLSYEIEVIGFSDEEGVRFGIPFIGSKALAGKLEPEVTASGIDTGIRKAILDFGLNPDELDRAGLSPNSRAYFEFHIEQGPVLEHLNLELGVVDSIVGQSRYELRFKGQANHAGTTPMHLRKDALAGVAEWILQVERHASSVTGLVATVGRIDASPGAGNVVPGDSSVSLDVRHADDGSRLDAVQFLHNQADAICKRRGLELETRKLLDQPAAPMDKGLSNILKIAVAAAGRKAFELNSGAGHDAMVLASCLPSAMLFIRSPRGLSHHPEESVIPEDVAAAIETGIKFLELLEEGKWAGE